MAEDIWAKINRLRVKDMSTLAPVVFNAVNHGISLCKGDSVVVTLSVGRTETLQLDPVVVETLRVQELQEIYFLQGSSRQRSVLKSMHCYGVAVDVISESFGWFTNKASIERWPDKDVRARVAIQWYRAVAERLMASKEMAWGGLWKRFPDSPHFQSARVPAVPNEAMISAYQKAGGGLAGREAVWKIFHLDATSVPVLA